MSNQNTRVIFAVNGQQNRVVLEEGRLSLWINVAGVPVNRSLYSLIPMNGDVDAEDLEPYPQLKAARLDEVTGMTEGGIAILMLPDESYRAGEGVLYQDFSNVVIGRAPYWPTIYPPIWMAIFGQELVEGEDYTLISELTPRPVSVLQPRTLVAK